MFRQSVVTISFVLSVFEYKQALHSSDIFRPLPGGTESQMLTGEVNLHSLSSLIGAVANSEGFFFLFPNGNHKVLSFYFSLSLVHIQLIHCSSHAV